MLNNNFERLVSVMDENERLSMIQKLAALDNKVIGDSNVANTTMPEEEFSTNISARYKQESFLLKVWIFFKSIFTSTSQKELYGEVIVSRWAKALYRKAPNLYNIRQNTLTTEFYNQLKTLSKAVDFFKPAIAAYEDSPGETFLLLGSLLMPEIYEKIEEDSNPYSMPFSKEPTQEAKAAFIRKIEEHLNNIQGENRSRLYNAVQSLDWLKQLVKLPYEKFLAWFSTATNGEIRCPLKSVFSEVAQFSKVICYPKQLQPECIEALCMLSTAAINANYYTKTTDEISADIECFNSNAIENVEKIRLFIRHVPFKLIAAVASESATWTLPKPSGVEEWFVVFKAQWRKQFDKKWESWLLDKRKDELRQHSEILFGEKRLPLLRFRPWTEAWGGIPCSKDYTLGFLAAFFEKVYSESASYIKTLLVEGEFVNRESCIAFTDVYNAMNQQSESVASYVRRLKRGGQIASTFENIASEKIRSLQSQSRMDSLMISVNSEVSAMASKFGMSIREMIGHLEGILRIKKTSRYDTITNLNVIQGPQNAAYRSSLLSALEKFELALDLLKDLEGIESATKIATL